MRNKSSKDIVPGVVFLVLAVVLYLLMPGQIKSTETSAFTARTFPTIALAMIGLCALILIFQGVWKSVQAKRGTKAAAAEEATQGARKGNMLMFLSVLALMIAAAVIGNFTSLLVSGLLLGVGFLALYRDKKPLHYAIVIAVVVISYFLFKQVFGLQLP